MNRRTLLAGAAAVLATTTIAQSQTVKRLWLLGDSLTVGFGADSYEQTWAYQLGGINLAISGSLCEEQVRCSVPYIPLWADRGDTVIWLTGYNDDNVDVYRDQFYKGMGQLLGYSVLVIGCPVHPHRDVSPYNAVASTVPWYTNCPDFPRMDDNHFSQAGHNQMAEFVRYQLQKPYQFFLPRIER